MRREVKYEFLTFDDGGVKEETTEEEGSGRTQS